jgi:transcription elongation factor Elf1
MKLLCPYCKVSGEAPDELTGKSIKCKSCGRVFNCQKTPDDSSILDIDDSKEEIGGFSLSKEQPALLTEPLSKKIEGNMEFINCPKCNKSVKKKETAVGKTIICNNCGYSGVSVDLNEKNDSNEDISQKVISGTSNLIGCVQSIGWFFGVVCIIGAVILFYNNDGNGALGVPAIITGVIFIVSGYYLGGIIRLLQEIIRSINRIKK